MAGEGRIPLHGRWCLYKDYGLFCRGIGGVETLLCLPHRLSDGNLLYIRLTYIMVILTTILVGARLGQLRRYGEEVALLDALPYLSLASFKSAILAP